VPGWWFSLGTPVSSTNKTNCHDITEILNDNSFHKTGLLESTYQFLKFIIFVISLRGKTKD
jgi:hypothetical protein